MATESSPAPDVNPTTAPAAPAVGLQATTSPASSDKDQPVLEGKALMDKLVQQIDFYFSRQNLATDSYLLKQMNAAKFVSVDVIAQFPKVLRLTTDRALLLEAMRQCPNCTLDDTEDMVRPTVQFARDTLILRDIPSSTPEEEVRGIFAFDGAATVLAIRSDVGDCWFVTFESEAECQKTAMALIGRTFQGKPVRARVKNSSMLRGVYKPPPGHTVLPPADTQGMHDPHAAGPGPQWGANPYYPPPYMNGWHGQGPGPQQQQPGYVYGGHGQQQWGGPGVVYGDGDYPRGGFARRGRGGGRMDGRMNGMDGRKKKPKTKRKGREGPNSMYPRKPGRRAQPTPMPSSKDKEPQLGPEDFPALPSVSGPKKSGNFKGKKYTREDMARIVRNMADSTGLSKPDHFPAPEECPVVRNTPLQDCQLLKPFPIMYPASPSPMLEPQPKEVLEMMPDLDLAGASQANSMQRSASNRSVSASGGGSGRWLATPMIGQSPPASATPFASVQVGSAVVSLVKTADADPAKENRPQAGAEAKKPNGKSKNAWSTRTNADDGTGGKDAPSVSSTSATSASVTAVGSATTTAPTVPTGSGAGTSTSASAVRSYADLLKKAVPVPSKS